jgi:activator of HSP90 ATPase
MNATPSLSTSAITRRHATGVLAATLGGIATGSFSLAGHAQEMAEKPSTGANKDRTAIHYDLEFKAGPERFYSAIVDEKQFAALTGMAATIDARAGGAFKTFGGMIEGRNIELVANRRIVQAWRPAHWDAGVYSIVRFELKGGRAGTSLSFDHIGFPAGDYDSLDSGWQSHYWGPLRKYFA